MAAANQVNLPRRSQLGRTITAIVVLSLGSLLFLGSLASAIPMSLSHFTDFWNGFADLSTYKLPFDQDLATSDAQPSATYSGVLISSSEALLLPRMLQLAHTLLTLFVLLSGSLVAVLLSIRLLQRKSFARHLRWSLITFGILIIVLATVGPQLDALAVDTATKTLGYPIYSQNGNGELTATTPDSIMLNLWDPIWILGRFDIILLMVGGLITMFGALVADGEHIQRETDGLV